MEKWVDIKGFENLYEVSNYGNVRRKGNKVNRKLCVNSRGYLLVVLCKNGKNYSHNVHRLVALHYISNPLNKENVNHIDGNKTNNYFKNLEWVTQKENVNHAIKTGLNETYFRKGDKHLNAKLNDKLALQIYDLAYHRIFQQWKIGEIYGVSQVLVKEIKMKRIWKHIHK